MPNPTPRPLRRPAAANALRTRPRLVIAFVIALLVPALTLPADQAEATTAGQTFHIDCSGAKGGDGTIPGPWNSIADVNSHGEFNPGDRILFHRGTTCRGRLQPAGEGSAAAVILIGAYGRGTAPVLAGGGTAYRTATIELRNQSYWTVQDLRITNRSSAKETKAYRSGVLLENDGGGHLPGITLRRLKIDSVVSNLAYDWKTDPRDWGGISVLTSNVGARASGFDNLRISDNRIVRVGRTGIVVSNYRYPRSADRNVRISSNRVTRSRGDSIILRGALDSRMDRNVSAYGADFWPCKQCGSVSPYTANAGIWTATSNRVVIERNEVYGEHKLGGDGVGLDVDLSAEGTVVQYNYVHDNEGGGLLFCGSHSTAARFNIFKNNERGAFVFIGGIPAYDSKIYNNTVYTKIGTDARVVHSQGGKGGKGISFFNNLIYNLDDSGYYVWPTKPKTKMNTYIGVHGIGEPIEVGKQYDDPGLLSPGSGGKGFDTLSGYRPNSPTDDPIGSPIPRSAKVDFFGKRIDPRKPPRGAAG